MRNFLGSLCLLVALAGTVHASTVWTGTNVRVDVSDPVHVGIGLDAVILTAEGLGGKLPNAFDGVGTPGDPNHVPPIPDDFHTGITTTGDGLHQVFEFAYQGSPTPTLDVISGPDAANQPIDTHFLVHSAGIAVTNAPSENQNSPYVVENAHGGFGNSLTGTFALTTAPTATWDFAYIVALPGTTVNLDFYLAGSNFSKELVTGSFTIVPEPSTGGLLLLAIAGLIAAARRHPCSTGRRRRPD